MKARAQRPTLVAKTNKPAKRPPSTTAAKRKTSKLPSTKPEVRLFVSYSHKDAAAQEKLHTHLAPWRNDDVSIWYDENIDPGAELGPEIARELRRAHIFVALFSPAYLDSHYCMKIEYKRAMSRRARGLMRVVGVVVKPCSWKQTPAKGFKLLPKDGREPERWSSTDAAYVNVAEGIGRLIKIVRSELTAIERERVRTIVKSTPPGSAVARKKLSNAAAPTKPKQARKAVKRAASKKP